MLDYKDPYIRQKISSVLSVIGKRIVEDEEFAKQILSELGDDFFSSVTKEKKVRKKPATKTNPIINIFEIFQTKGKDDLSSFLNSLDLQGLKTLVLDNGLDPAQKVRKWRSKEKISTFIVETVSKQMSKGGAFLK